MVAEVREGLRLQELAAGYLQVEQEAGLVQELGLQEVVMLAALEQEVAAGKVDRRPQVGAVPTCHPVELLRLYRQSFAG